MVWRAVADSTADQSLLFSVVLFSLVLFSVDWPLVPAPLVPAPARSRPHPRACPDATKSYSRTFVVSDL
ncbi:hypothetical protein DFH06DRAFT_1335685 [Mycena polygramma]|nr:hypothetical protein DFH06DRAFT_1335685 [Mycena polygramma]